MNLSEWLGLEFLVKNIDKYCNMYMETDTTGRSEKFGDVFKQPS